MPDLSLRWFIFSLLRSRYPFSFLIIGWAWGTSVTEEAAPLDAQKLEMNHLKDSDFMIPPRTQKKKVIAVQCVLQLP